MNSIVILASGRGTNFEAIAVAVEKGLIPAQISAVISDRPAAEVLQKAKARGIPTRVVVETEGLVAKEEKRAAFDEKLSAVLQEFKPHFLVLAGFMRILSPSILRHFRSQRGYSRTVNVHPSLLPAFVGMRAYQQAFRHGAMVSGATVHLVEEGLDNGPILAQEAFSIAEFESEEQVERRGLEIEHRLYPATLAWVIPEKFDIQEVSPGRFRVRPH